MEDADDIIEVNVLEDPTYKVVVYGVKKSNAFDMNDPWNIWGF